MDMPITVEIVDEKGSKTDIDEVFDYFTSIDETFSTFKETSEISRINRGEVTERTASLDVQKILRLSEETRQDTDGYFDIRKKDGIDPSGLVKGWAIYEAAKLLDQKGLRNFYIDAGGDIETRGSNEEGKKWRVGIRNPFNRFEHVKVLEVSGVGVATSGTYIRGQHIYDPHDTDKELTDIVSVTVIAPNIYEADRFATAAFAMGKNGIHFIEHKEGLEGYQIDKNGIAVYTSHFSNYCI